MRLIAYVQLRPVPPRDRGVSRLLLGPGEAATVSCEKSFLSSGPRPVPGDLGPLPVSGSMHLKLLRYLLAAGRRSTASSRRSWVPTRSLTTRSIGNTYNFVGTRSGFRKQETPGTTLVRTRITVRRNFPLISFVCDPFHPPFLRQISSSLSYSDHKNQTANRRP